MQKITPCLWFDNQAEEAMNFYTSIFKHSKVGNVTRYGEAGPGPEGSVLVASFELDGQEFTALNGGPAGFAFSPAISFFVNCKTQEEVDELWEKLSEGGEKEQCGWLKDKYGVSWQIVPTILGEMLSDPDPERSQRVMQKMLQMQKIDIKILQQATEGVAGAVKQAKAAAGDKNVSILGASIDQQCFKARLADEIVIHLAPILLGEGVRLFDHLGAEAIELKRTEAVSTTGMTSLRFCVMKL